MSGPAVRISACVVMYGENPELKDCLYSLAKHSKSPGFVLYLVDNASPNQALKRLKQSGLPGAVLPLPQAKNRGFGKGHNAVLPMLNSRYHAVVNPDVEVKQDVLSMMADWMDEHPDVAMCCPRLQYQNGQEQHVAKRRPALLPLIARQVALPLKCLKEANRHYLMLDEDLTRPIDVEFCSGSFFLIRTDIFKKIGGFDEKYFMYVEDADITQKAKKHGRAVFLPDVCVTHAWHRNTKKSARHFFWQVRSMIRYFAKWGFCFK